MRRPRARVLPVRKGRVRCPRRGDVPVDACRRCRELLRVALRDGAPQVVCAPPRQSPLDAWAGLAAGEEGVRWRSRG